MFQKIFEFNKLILLLIFFMSLFSGNSSGQSSDNVIRGQVKDQKGDLILGAEVILSQDGEKDKTVRTDNLGNFIFRNLNTGNFKLNVKVKGFKDFTDENIVLSKSQTKTVDITLTIETKETVTIGDNNNNSTDPDRSGSTIILKGKDLDFLPDNPEDLASVLSALSGAVGPDGAEFLVEGFSGANGRLPSRRQISEVRINQNPFTAEYDRIGFGRVSLNLSPTTEEFHGESEFYFSDESFNSRNPFSSNKPPFQVRNIFGAVSGPLVKKRASFYVGASREAFDSNAVINAIVLNNQLIPTPFSRGILTPEREIYSLFRVDYKASTNTDLVFNYQYLPNNSKGNGIGQLALESKGYTQTDNSAIYRLLGTTILNPKTVYQYRFQLIDNVNKTTDVNTTPTINVLDSFVSGGSELGSSQTKTKRLEIQNHITTTIGANAFRFGGTYRFTSINDFTPLNFNGSYTFEGGTAPQLDSNGNIVLGTNGQPIQIAINSIERYRRTLFLQQRGILANEIRRRGGGATQFSISTGNPQTKADYHDIGVYGQYDWRVKASLNLGLGLRYERQTNISNNSNFAPRLSFAWAPGATDSKSPKTVIRGGIGIFYGRVPVSLTLQASQFDGTRQQNFVSRSPSVLDLFPALPPASALNVTPQESTSRKIAADLSSSYSYQTALSIETQITKQTTFSATYIQARYLHLLRSRNINAPLPGTFISGVLNSGIRPFPNQGNIYLFESSGWLNQRQLIFNLTSRINPKIFVFSTFTINKSKADTNGSTSFPVSSYDLTPEYGSANNDIRLRFNFGATVNTFWGIRLSPFITTRSGLPFDITTGRDANGDNLFTERPALATDLSRPSIVSTKFGNFDLNPLPGEKIIPLNFGRGPSFFVTNLRASKSIPVGPSKLLEGGKKGEKPYSLNISIAVQNIFNKNNAGTPIGNLSSPLFGFSTSSSTEGGSSNADSNRRINFSINFEF
jgi:hypothetical protein